MYPKNLLTEISRANVGIWTHAWAPRVKWIYLLWYVVIQIALHRANSGNVPLKSKSEPKLLRPLVWLQILIPFNYFQNLAFSQKLRGALHFPVSKNYLLQKPEPDVTVGLQTYIQVIKSRSKSDGSCVFIITRQNECEKDGHSRTFLQLKTKTKLNF